MEKFTGKSSNGNVNDNGNKKKKDKKIAPNVLASAAADAVEVKECSMVDVMVILEAERARSKQMTDLALRQVAEIAELKWRNGEHEKLQEKSTIAYDHLRKKYDGKSAKLAECTEHLRRVDKWVSEFTERVSNSADVLSTKMFNIVDEPEQMKLLKPVKSSKSTKNKIVQADVHVQKKRIIQEVDDAIEEENAKKQKVEETEIESEVDDVFESDLTLEQVLFN